MRRAGRWAGAVIVLAAASCASRPAPRSDEPRPAEGVCTTIPRGAGAEVSERLDRAANVVEFENTWKEAHPTASLGSVDRAAVSSLIRSKTPEVQGCYESALGTLRDGRGKVVVRFVIDASGKVPHVAVSSNDFDDPAVGCCVASRVAAWPFPAPSSGEFVVIEYPFVVRISGSQ